MTFISWFFVNDKIQHTDRLMPGPGMATINLTAKTDPLELNRFCAMRRANAHHILVSLTNVNFPPEFDPWKDWFIDAIEPIGNVNDDLVEEMEEIKTRDTEESTVIVSVRNVHLLNGFRYEKMPPMRRSCFSEDTLVSTERGLGQSRTLKRAIWFYRKI